MKQPHDEMKTTVPNPSVGADGEQPSSKESTKSIADSTEKSKTDDEIMREHLRALREMSRLNDLNYLHSCTEALTVNILRLWAICRRQ